MSDIRHDSFNFGNMHFGATGADNDAQSPTSGQRMSEMVMGAPTGFSGVGSGQQAPSDGKGDLK